MLLAHVSLDFMAHIIGRVLSCLLYEQAGLREIRAAKHRLFGFAYADDEIRRGSGQQQTRSSSTPSGSWTVLMPHRLGHTPRACG